jgi:hypothetical protein
VPFHLFPPPARGCGPFDPIGSADLAAGPGRFGHRWEWGGVKGSEPLDDDDPLDDDPLDDRTLSTIEALELDPGAAVGPIDRLGRLARVMAQDESRSFPRPSMGSRDDLDDLG